MRNGVGGGTGRHRRRTRTRRLRPRHRGRAGTRRLRPRHRRRTRTRPGYRLLRNRLGLRAGLGLAPRLGLGLRSRVRAVPAGGLPPRRRGCGRRRRSRWPAARRAVRPAAVRFARRSAGVLLHRDLPQNLLRYRRRAAARHLPGLSATRRVAPYSPAAGIRAGLPARCRDFPATPARAACGARHHPDRGTHPDRSAAAEAGTATPRPAPEGCRARPW